MNKCTGCGKDYEGDTGFCFSCRVVLYTPLQIAESDFRHSEFRTMVFPVRDIIWLQDRLRLREAELKAMDIVNDEMVGKLAEARAEVERLTKALADKRADKLPEIERNDDKWYTQDT